MSRILFHCVHDATSLNAVADLALRARDVGHEIAFHFARGGAYPPCREWLQKYSVREVTDNPSAYQAQVMIVTDCGGWDRTTNQEYVIDIGHGLGSKDRYYLPDTPYKADVTLMPSQYIRELAGRGEDEKFRVVGIPKLDRFHRKPATNFLPHVLVAPTFNPGYNCLEMIAPYLQGLTENYQVRVRPHPHFFASGDPAVKYWVSFFQSPPEGVTISPNTFVVDDLIWADVVVSDISSVYLEALACGLPVVVCESPTMTRGVDLRRTEYRFLRYVTSWTGVWPGLESTVDYTLRHETSLPRPPLNDFLFPRPPLNDFPGEGIQKVLELL